MTFGDRFLTFFRLGSKNEGKPADMLYRITVMSALLLSILYLVLLLSLIGFAAGEAVTGEGEDAQAQGIAILLTPPWVFVILSLSIVNGLVTNVWMSAGFILKKTLWLKRSYFTGFTIIVMNLFLFIFMQMRGNGVAVLKEYKDAKTFRFARPSSEILVEFAMEEPEEWLNLQETFTCCGVNMYSAYGKEVYPDIEDFDFDQLHSNEQKCNFNNLNVAVNDTVKTTDVEEAEDESATFFPDYFCEDFILPLLRQYAIRYSILIGFVTFVQAMVLFAASRLFFSYMESEGGFKEDYDKYIGARMVVEDTVLQKAGFEPNAPPTSRGAKASKRLKAQNLKF
mmetsp:Transcript_7496/g.8621  ORF Transcript_7496/g.8621 Transcript_7496/m.8621 type:complete len:339 (-) Transcript_7496:94-1110(-)